MRRCVWVKLVALILLRSLALAQEHGIRTAEEPAPILPGLGDYHHPIATQSAAAQRFFDQGLTLVYAFNQEEALRSFLHAAQLDPASPMPVWGVALAVGPNYNLEINPDREKVAYKAIQEARRLAAAAPEKERAYVEALSRRYSADDRPDFQALNRNYRNAMRELARRYPDDPDAATLYAESIMDLHPWSLWTAAGPTEDTTELLEVLQAVLRQDTRHPGANHFYIHAIEASPHPEMALPSAHVLETLIPAAGHLLHMPSHIYVRLGKYAEAVKSNEEAAHADRDYLRAAQMQDSVYGRMYYSHNLQFLWILAGTMGKFSEARQAADELWANVSPAVKRMPMLEPLLAGPALVRVRFQRWDDILNLPVPDISLTASNAFWRYSRGVAFSAKGALAKAQAERQQLAALVAQQPAAGHNLAPDVPALALEVLDARIADARGDRHAALAHWRRAVEMQDALPYSEPPDWYYPVRESLGGELARDIQYAEAEKVFRADLKRNPGNPRSLFGLFEALTAQNKADAARPVQKQFQEAWKYAEGKLRLKDL